MSPSREDSSADFLPSETIPVVRLNPETHQRELVHLRWGLVPSWASAPSRSSRLIHARSETVATKLAFRDAFHQRRCLVVADRFDLGKGRSGKEAYVIQRKDHRPFGVGAIWERWEKGGEPVESCAVITTSANELVKPINERMPVIIAEEDYEVWLDPQFFDLQELERMMRPYPAHKMEVIPVP